jgi:uncharacterized membrane protein
VSAAPNRVLFVLAVLGIASSAPACASSTEPSSSCVSATACPTDVPSYKAAIVPILEQTCIPCHTPGGLGRTSMTTYAEVSAESGAMLSQVTVCAMPPLNGPAITDAQRTTLTAWLRCGAPDN